MRTEPKNPNDRKNNTPSTKGKKRDDKKFTSYDTSKKETASPQVVREGKESPSEMERLKKAKGS